MRRRFLILLLGAGTVLGFGSGFASMARARAHWGPEGGCQHGGWSRYGYAPPAVVEEQPAPTPPEKEAARPAATANTASATPQQNNTAPSTVTTPNTVSPQSVQTVYISPPVYPGQAPQYVPIQAPPVQQLAQPQPQQGLAPQVQTQYVPVYIVPPGYVPGPSLQPQA